MHADTIRWILIGVGLAALLSIAFVSPLIKKHRMLRDNVPEEKTKRVTCSIPSCEVFYKRQNHDSRYCKFHHEVQKLLLELVKVDSQAQHRARMYLNTNGTFYMDEKKREDVYKDLQKELDKAQGKTTVKKAAPKKTAAKKTATVKKAPAKKATPAKKTVAKKPVNKKK